MRYALHARVVFAWDDAKGEKHESRGHTRTCAKRAHSCLRTSARHAMRASR